MARTKRSTLGRSSDAPAKTKRSKLGRSNDSPAAVKVEMRAADWFSRIIDEWNRIGPAQFLPRGSRLGWECHMDGEDTTAGVMAGWLLREMYMVRADLPDVPMELGEAISNLELVQEQTRHDVAKSVERHDRAAALGRAKVQDDADDMRRASQQADQDQLVLPCIEVDSEFDTGKNEDDVLEDDDAISPPIETLGPEISDSLRPSGDNEKVLLTGDAALAALRMAIDDLSDAHGIPRDARLTYATEASPGDCEDLVAFVDGELPPDRADAFRRHLLTCSTCELGVVEAAQLSARLSTGHADSPTTHDVEPVDTLTQRGNADSKGDACMCGHPVEEHGNDDVYPGSTACSQCDCIAYENAG